MPAPCGIAILPSTMVLCSTVSCAFVFARFPHETPCRRAFVRCRHWNMRRPVTNCFCALTSAALRAHFLGGSTLPCEKGIHWRRSSLHIWAQKSGVRARKHLAKSQASRPGASSDHSPTFHLSHDRQPMFPLPFSRAGASRHISRRADALTGAANSRAA